MKHAWTIEPTYIKKVKAFLDLHRDSPFARQRIEWNLRNEQPSVEKAVFWQQKMVTCLLTKQKRFGPTSAVTRFIEWTWDGNYEMDPAQGRCWAVVNDDELHGMIFFHGGDDSEFLAIRKGQHIPKPKKPKR